MLSGVKFLPRDQIEGEKGIKSDDSGRKNRKSSKKDRGNRRNSKYNSSDDEVEKVKKVSRKKKWYASDESVSLSSGSEPSSDGERQMDRHRKEKKKKKKRYSDSSDGEDGDNKTNLKSGHNDNCESMSANDVNIVRKEMGLEWMLRPAARPEQNAEALLNEKQEEPLAEERQKMNPRELNPYLKDNGSGYPEELDQAMTKTVKDNLSSSSVVGDGGASWRLKALKRAKEQAAREGRRLDEVVEERWGSLGHLAVSVASSSAAPSRAHLHAIRSRKLGQTHENNLDADNHDKDAGQHSSRNYMKDISVDRPKMRAPNVHDSLSWKKRKGQCLSNEDANLVASAVSSLNKFADDGNFMHDFEAQHSKISNFSSDTYFEKSKKTIEETDLSNKNTGRDKQPLSANQLVAKAMQLRMKGKHDEAEILMKEVHTANTEKQTGEHLTRLKNEISTSRYVMQDTHRRQKEKEDNSDVVLAQQITKSKSYSLSGRADDEYDFDGGPSSKKSRKKNAGDEKKLASNPSIVKRIATQQERCLFCFENPNRPKHLVVAIANFTYLMLPQRQHVVPGHCCILTLQHESSTRTVDDNVWEEIRNFKKCLIMMFAKQEKEVVFLETVMGLAQQRRHCMIECIPLPQEIAKQGPLYFKKAIDEAEEEWSQHNAKKLIDTSQKGLRACIPKNFPYFHVEFGLKRGFVHVIDDETQFKNNLGLNVIRGMMQLPEEDMYRRRRYETVDAQKQAVLEFMKEWDPFDWTKQLA